MSRLEEGASGVPSIRGMARGRTLILVDNARVVESPDELSALAPGRSVSIAIGGKR